MQNDGSISPVRAFLRNKWVRAVLAIDTLAVVAIIGFVVYNATKTATVVLDVAPLDASIQIGLGGGYTNGSYSVHPGTYDITISHDGLEPKTFAIELKSGYVTTLTTFLTSEDNGFEFYKFKNNYESYQKLVEIASKENNITTDQDTSAEQFIADFQYALSIRQTLPIKGYVYAEPTVNSSTAGFTIRDGIGQKGCEVSTCLLVNYYGVGYETAVAEKIEEAGYDPSDYQIIYERYNK